MFKSINSHTHINIHTHIYIYIYIYIYILCHQHDVQLGSIKIVIFTTINIKSEL